jgi:hypothetical protein
LEGAIDQGTGWRAQLEDRPAAGKTGTTQNYADAVFAGYTPQRTTAVWVGFPEAQIPMIPPTTDRKVYGGTYPAMIWKDVMEAAHFGLPSEEFPGLPPANTVFIAPRPLAPEDPANTVFIAPRPLAPEDPSVDVAATTTLPSDHLATPELTGLTLDNARAMLAEADHGVWIAEVREVEVSGTEAGTIIGQEPLIGSTIEVGGTMLVEVAVEPPVLDGVDVPDVTLRILKEARPLLEELGLGFSIVVVADPDQPAWEEDLVWSQDPLPGVIVNPGSVIRLRVAP